MPWTCGGETNDGMSGWAGEYCGETTRKSGQRGDQDRLEEGLGAAPR